MSTIIRTLETYRVIKRFLLLVIGIIGAYFILNLKPSIMRLISSPTFDQEAWLNFLYTLIFYVIIVVVLIKIVDTLDSVLHGKYKELKERVVGLIITYEPIELDELADYLKLNEHDVRKCISDINIEGKFKITIDEDNIVKIIKEGKK